MNKTADTNLCGIHAGKTGDADRSLLKRNQKFCTLVAVFRFGAPPLSKSLLNALSELRQEFGYRKSYREFFEWYHKQYPGDYAIVF